MMSAAEPKKVLGRGLSSLLDDISDKVRAIDPIEQEERQQQAISVTTLPIESLAPNPDQPRRYFAEDKLEELADSIRQKGVVQPIVVRPSPHRAGEYEIVAGERRWKAAQRARLHEVPVVIRDFDDQDALEVAIIENVQRADLNPIEEALAYQQLIDKYSYTQDALAQSLGKGRVHVANTLRLLNLPREVQDMVRQGDLSAGLARTVLSAADPLAFAKEVVRKKMSVRAAEAAVKSFGAAKRGSPFVAADPNTRAVEDELSACLRMRVAIRSKGEQGGEIVITYRTLEDLDDVRAALLGETRAMLASG